MESNIDEIFCDLFSLMQDNETVLQRVLCYSYESVILAKKVTKTDADKQLWY